MTITTPEVERHADTGAVIVYLSDAAIAELTAADVSIVRLESGLREDCAEWRGERF